MKDKASAIIERMIPVFFGRTGVRGLALVGSRGSDDASRIDEHSDVDVLVCCTVAELEDLIKAEWLDDIARTILVFPLIMDDEIRVIYEGPVSCDFHFLTTEKACQLSGPCALGNYFASGFRVLHDPDEILVGLAKRVEPTREDDLSAEAKSSAYWFNLFYCANLVARGDLFRAGPMANHYLPLFLLGLLRPIDGSDDTKYVAQKVRPDQYEALTATVAPLTKEGLIAGLRRSMSCYWRFRAEVAPDLDPVLIAAYREIEAAVEAKFGACLKQQTS